MKLSPPFIFALKYVTHTTDVILIPKYWLKLTFLILNQSTSVRHFTKFGIEPSGQLLSSGQVRNLQTQYKNYNIHLVKLFRTGGRSQ